MNAANNADVPGPGARAGDGVKKTDVGMFFAFFLSLCHAASLLFYTITLGYPLFPTLPTGREKWAGPPVVLAVVTATTDMEPVRVSFAWSALPTVPLPALRRTPSPCP